MADLGVWTVGVSRLVLRPLSGGNIVPPSMIFSKYRRLLPDVAGVYLPVAVALLPPSSAKTVACSLRLSDLTY